MTRAEEMALQGEIRRQLEEMLGSCP